MKNIRGIRMVAAREEFNEVALAIPVEIKSSVIGIAGIQSKSGFRAVRNTVLVRIGFTSNQCQKKIVHDIHVVPSGRASPIMINEDTNPVVRADSIGLQLCRRDRHGEVSALTDLGGPRDAHNLLLDSLNEGTR